MSIGIIDWEKLDESIKVSAISESLEEAEVEESFDKLTFSEVYIKAVENRNKRIALERKTFIIKAKKEIHKMIVEDFEHVGVQIKDRFKKESIDIVNDVIAQIKSCGFKVEIIKEKYGSQVMRIYSR